MAECEEQIFVNTDVDILLNPKKGFTLADVTDMVVTLTHAKEAQAPVVYSIDGGGIEINGSLIFLLVLKGDILEVGCYTVTVRLFDSTTPTAKERGVSPCVLPEETPFLKFVA